jgi:hypothetical protein
METGLPCLLFLAIASAAGQQLPGPLHAQINANLRLLRSLPAGDPLPDLTAISPESHLALKQRVSESNPRQDRIMRLFAFDIASSYRDKPVVPWNFAFALTTVLAGREVPDEMLTRLTDEILDAFDAAFACRNQGCYLGYSAEFRRAAEQVRDELVAVGVSKADALQVAGGIMEGGRLIASPPRLRVMPIPPAGWR